jgi:hypothetical protein
VDEELRERAVAHRAAVSRMEEALGYDYQGNIQNLLTWIQQPANATFTVEGLAPPAASGGGPAPAPGTVAIDASDPLRVRITVTVSWSGRRGQRRLELPMTVTEVKP